MPIVSKSDVMFDEPSGAIVSPEEVDFDVEPYRPNVEPLRTVMSMPPRRNMLDDIIEQRSVVRQAEDQVRQKAKTDEQEQLTAQTNERENLIREYPKSYARINAMFKNGESPELIRDVVSKLEPPPPSPQTEISQAQPEKRPVAAEFMERFTAMSPERADAVRQISLSTGMEPAEVSRNFDEITKEIFPERYATGKELVEQGFGAAILAGMMTNPVGTIRGVGTFMGISEIENAIVSKLTGQPYQPLAGKGIPEFLPTDVNEQSKTLVEMLDFIGKAAAAAGIGKLAGSAFDKLIPKQRGLVILDANKLYAEGGISKGEAYRRAMSKMTAEEKAVFLKQKIVEEVIGKPPQKPTIIPEVTPEPPVAKAKVAPKGKPQITEEYIKGNVRILDSDVAPPLAWFYGQTIIPRSTPEPPAGEIVPPAAPAPPPAKPTVTAKKQAVPVVIGKTKRGGLTYTITQQPGGQYIARSRKGNEFTMNAKDVESTLKRQESARKAAAKRPSYAYIDPNLTDEADLPELFAVLGMGDKGGGELAMAFDGIKLSGKGFGQLPYDPDSPRSEDSVISRYVDNLVMRGDISRPTAQEAQFEEPIESRYTYSEILDAVPAQIEYLKDLKAMSPEDRDYIKKHGGFVAYRATKQAKEMEDAYIEYLRELPERGFTEDEIARIREGYNEADIERLRADEKVGIREADKTISGLAESPEEEAKWRAEVDLLKAEEEAKKPPVSTLNADLTTAVTDLKDSITGETIPAGTEHYYIPETKQTFTVDQYRKMQERPEQTGLFKEVEVKKAEKQPLAEYPDLKPTKVPPPSVEPGYVKGVDQTSMVAGLEGKMDMFGEEVKKLPTEGAGPQPLSAQAWGVSLEQEPVSKEKINKTQIMMKLESLFKVPIRSKATHKWRSSVGMYYPQKAIVRMKTWGELSVASHEVAHHIDAVLKKNIGLMWKGRLPQSARAELKSLDYKPERGSLKEGFAEYMRHYLTTGDAQKVAPAFTKEFFQTLEKNAPEFIEKIAEAKKLMDTWSQQGAEERIIQHIDFKGEHTKIAGLSNRMKSLWRQFEDKIRDELYPLKRVTEEIKKITGKDISPTKDPYAIATFYKQKAGSIARTFVMDKAIDEQGKVVGKGLREILEPINNEDMKSFIAYAVSKRAVDLENRGIESGIEISDAKYMIDTYDNPTWNTAVKEITTWSNHFIDWIVRAGGLGESEAKIIRELNPIYVPFKRAFLEEMTVVRGGAGGLFNRGEAIKRIKGSGRPIINPLESLVSMSTEMITKAQKLRIASAFAQLAKEKSVGGFITEVPAPTGVRNIHLWNIKDFERILHEMGLLEEGEITDLNMDKVVTIFTRESQYRGKENIVSIWIDGKRKFYEIHPDLYKSMMSMDPLQVGPLVRILSPFSRLLRLGTVGLKASFGLRNPWRDAATYSVFSKEKGASPATWAKGLAAEATTKEGELVWRFKKGGGSLSGMIGFDRASVQSAYDDLLSSRLSKMGKTLRIIRKPWTGLQIIRDFISFGEMVPRSAELIARYETYKREQPDWTEEDWYMAAFNDAQDVTVNFTRSGAWTKKINPVTAFFTAAVNGPDKMFRAAKNNPSRFVVRGLGWITLPTLVLWYINKDKDWYKNLPPSYKYSNYFFELTDNVIARMPIPFELGTIFTSAPLAGLDIAYEKDPEAIKGVIDVLIAQVPDPTPTVLQPIFDIWKDKNWLGQPIEGKGMQYQYPTERKRTYTSSLAMNTSRGFDKIGLKISPIQLDYLFGAYTGNVMRQFGGNTLEPANIPVLGDFLVRMPDEPRRQIDEFYAEYERLSQRVASDIATMDEQIRLQKMKSYYTLLNGTLFKIVRQTKESKNIGVTRKAYKVIGEVLDSYNKSIKIAKGKGITVEPTNAEAK